MEIASVESYFGVQLAAGVSCGPGTLINLNSSGQGRLADNYLGYKAHGIAFTSGSGTKVPGTSQWVRLDKFAKVANIDYVTLVQGGTVYTALVGRYGISSGTGIAQKVGLGLQTDEAFVEIDPATFDD